MSLDTIAPIIGIGAAAILRHLLDSDVVADDLVESLGWRGDYIYGNGNAILFAGTLSSTAAALHNPIVSLFLLHDDKHVRATNKLNADSDGDLVASGEAFQTDEGLRFECIMAGDALGRIRNYHNVTALVIISDQGRAVSRQRFTLGRGRKLLNKSVPRKLDCLAFHMVNLVRLSGQVKPGSYKSMIRATCDHFSLNAVGKDQLRQLVKDNRNQYATSEQIVQMHDALFDEHSIMDRDIESFIAAMLADEIHDHENYHTEAHSELLGAVVSHRLAPKLCHSICALIDRIEEYLVALSKHEAAESQQQDRAYKSALATLQLAIGATKDEIKTAYRLLMKQFHPDTLRHMSGAHRRVLENEAKGINAAYDLLMKSAKGTSS